MRLMTGARNIFISIFLGLIVAACGGSGGQNQLGEVGSEPEVSDPNQDSYTGDGLDLAGQDVAEPPQVIEPGRSGVVYIMAAGVGPGDEDSGLIAVKITVPQVARYPEGAPVVVEVPRAFDAAAGFSNELPAGLAGLIHVTLLWPGQVGPGADASGGEFDFGGPHCLAGLRDVVRFALGDVPTHDGHFLHELVGVTPLVKNVGIYGYSDGGIPATNLLAVSGRDLGELDWLITRETPTEDTMIAGELGFWQGLGGARSPVFNPYYSFPEGYDADQVKLDWSLVDWGLDPVRAATGLPFFSGELGEHWLLEEAPVIYGRRFFSRSLTRALEDNEALSPAAWPENLATPAMADAFWPSRVTTGAFSAMTEGPKLKVMLLFARDDHAQVALDKPHVHQAWDGFARTAGLWTRLNPDRAYLNWAMGLGDDSTLPDNPANAAPQDWSVIRSWAYPNFALDGRITSLAAAAELADRTRFENSEVNLDQVLFDFPAPMDLYPGDVPRTGGSMVVQIPSEAAGDAGISARIYYPGPDQTRYLEGAPIAVVFPGTNRFGTLQLDGAEDAAVDHGVVLITFLLPGGEEGMVSSGGEYDYRGADSLRAAAEVLLFALGQIPDLEGRYLTDSLPWAQTRMVGGVGQAHGGNLLLKVLELYGEELGGLDWIQLWESPIGDQFAALDLGRAGGVLNNLYTPGTCTLQSCSMPTLVDKLAFSPTTPLMLQDRQGMDHEFAGGFYIDLDGNGMANDGEFFFTPMSGPSTSEELLVQGYLSVEVRMVVDSYKGRLFKDAPPPAWLAPVDDVLDFWALRDGSTSLIAIKEQFPELSVMITGTREDHLQGQPDHPHIRSLLSSLISLGMPEVLLNPSPAHCAEVTGEAQELYPDNQPATPAAWPGVDELLLPEDGGTDGLLPGILDLSDRTHDRLWD